MGRGPRARRTRRRSASWARHSAWSRRRCDPLARFGHGRCCGRRRCCLRCLRGLPWRPCLCGLRCLRWLQARVLRHRRPGTAKPGNALHQRLAARSKRAQCLRQLAHARIARIAILLETAIEHSLELGRCIRAKRGQRNGWGADDLDDVCAGRVRFERSRSSHQLLQHDPQRPYVSSGIHITGIARLLR